MTFPKTKRAVVAAIKRAEARAYHQAAAGLTTQNLLAHDEYRLRAHYLTIAQCREDDAEYIEKVEGPSARDSIERMWQECQR